MHCVWQNKHTTLFVGDDWWQIILLSTVAVQSGQITPCAKQKAFVYLGFICICWIIQHLWTYLGLTCVMFQMSSVSRSDRSELCLCLLRRYNVDGWWLYSVRLYTFCFIPSLPAGKVTPANSCLQTSAWCLVNKNSSDEFVGRLSLSVLSVWHTDY